MSAIYIKEKNYTKITLTFETKCLNTVPYTKTVRDSEEGGKYNYANYEYVGSLKSGVCYI